MAPTQHEKLAPETCLKASAIECCLSCPSGYTFEAWMTVDRVNNILAAVDSVGVTNSICGY